MVYKYILGLTVPLIVIMVIRIQLDKSEIHSLNSKVDTLEKTVYEEQDKSDTCLFETSTITEKNKLLNSMRRKYDNTEINTSIGSGSISI